MQITYEGLNNLTLSIRQTMSQATIIKEELERRSGARSWLFEQVAATISESLEDGKLRVVSLCSVVGLKNLQTILSIAEFAYGLFTNIARILIEVVGAIAKWR